MKRFLRASAEVSCITTQRARPTSHAVLIAAALTVVSTSAQAALLAPLDLSTGSAGFANAPVAGAFVDSATFTLTTASTVDASVITSTLASKDIDFSSIVVSGPGGTFGFTTLLGDPQELVALSGATLTPGTYTIVFTGTNSSGRGAYGGNLATTPLTGSVTPSAGSNGGHALDLSGGSTGFFNTPAAGAFVDTFSFTLSTTRSVSSGLTSALNVSQDIDFTSIDISGPGGTSSFTALLGDPIEAWALSSVDLAPGNYLLTVRGVNSAGGASYGGDLVTDVASTAVGTVPEPATPALVVGALGVALITSRRRRR